MKKPMSLIVTIFLVFGLTACSGGSTEKENDTVSDQSIEEDRTEEESKDNNEKESLINNDTDIEDTYETNENTKVPEETIEDEIIDGIDMDNPPANWGTPDGPQVAAKNYYADTVFELVSLDVRQSSKEYVKFSVVSKKDGELVDPNRTIELRYENGTWNVINEGY